jgi:hypothetical protein
MPRLCADFPKTGHICKRVFLWERANKTLFDMEKDLFICLFDMGKKQHTFFGPFDKELGKSQQDIDIGITF